MKIVIFGINYFPEPAGIAPYTTGLAEHFADGGHEVRVITGIPHYPTWRPGSAPTITAANPRVRRHRHYVPRRPTALGRALYEVTWMVSAARSIVDLEADVVLGVVPSLSGGVLAWAAGRRLGVPFGLLFQDTIGMAARQSGYSGAPRLAGSAGLIEGFISRRAARIAVVADGFGPYLRGLGVVPERIQRVRNWARWNPSDETPEACRSRLGWQGDEFICLHAGNMGRKQALENLIRTAELLDGTQIRVVLAGDGNDKARLIGVARARCVKNVSFVDVQPPGSYEAMLRAADVLLINQRPSVADMALPSKIGSYLSAGRPVVAAVGRRSETAIEIEHSGAGILVPPGDARALAETLGRLQSGNALSNRLATNGMAFARTHLHPGMVMQGYDRFLDALRGIGAGSKESMAMQAEKGPHVH